MPNDIPARQNEPEFTRLLAAYGHAYDAAEWYGTWKTWLAVGTALAVPTVNAFFPSFAPWGALLALAVLLADELFFEREVKGNRELGAKIQELFDTRLFGIPWNDVKAGPPPEPEVIAGLAADFEKKHAKNEKRMARLKDWYPKAAGDLPIELGRLVCQRASMWWDAGLRRGYCNLYAGLIVALILGGVVYGLAMGMSLPQFLLSVAAPIVPAAVKVWRGRTKHIEAAAASDRARQALEGAWTKAMAGAASADVLDMHARRIQDELFDRRRTAERIPNWYYWWNRDKFEAQMNSGAEEYAAEAKAKLAAAA